MPRVKVRDPQGQVWRVTRRWFPWRLRRRDVSKINPTIAGTDDLAGLIFVAALFLLLLVAPFLFVAVIVVLEALLLILLIPFVVVGRVLLGRHWRVEVRRDFKPVWETEAGDWGDSRVLIHDLAAQLERGMVPWEADSSPAP